MNQLQFQNPHEDVTKRDFYSIGTPSYELMMNFLHHEFSKAQRLYYCGTHHTIETVSTYETHKENKTCKVYIRGQVLGKFIFYFLVLIVKAKKNKKQLKK